tara:strand:- start:135 stop:956 length:822 start_codon:yes stop_codon:yes gene_type:complete
MKKFILLLSVLFLFSCTKETIKFTLTTSSNPVEAGTASPDTRQYNEGDTANLTAIAAAEYEFKNWTGAMGGSETTVVMNSDKTVVANFVKKKYALTTAVEGEGTITEKIIKAGAATDYNSGTVLELTASPSSGWKFKEWQGDLTGAVNPTQITIDKSRTVTAVFEILLNSYTIYVSSSTSLNYSLKGNDRNGEVSGNDPDLTFKVGDEVIFIVDASPFYLKTKAGIGTDNQITGITNNGTQGGTIVWKPTTAGTYYYQCLLHSEMVGTITIQN